MNYQCIPEGVRRMINYDAAKVEDYDPFMIFCDRTDKLRKGGYQEQKHTEMSDDLIGQAKVKTLDTVGETVKSNTCIPSYRLQFFVSSGNTESDWALTVIL